MTLRPRLASNIPWVIGLIVVVTVLMGGGLALNLLRERQMAVTEARARATTLVASLERHTRRVLETSNLILDRVMVAVDGRPWSAVAADPRVPDLMARLVNEISYLQQLWLADAQGVVRAVGGSFPAPTVTIGRRPYFERARQQPDTAALVVGPPVESDFAGRRYIPVARPLYDSQGRFRGVVAGAVDPAYFPDFFRALRIGPESTMGLIHTDGTLLSREPFDPATIGTDASGSRIVQRFWDGETEATLRAVSPLDGTVRHGAYKALKNLPLLVYVAVAERDALIQWRQEMRQQLLTAAVALVMILLLAGLVVQRIRREERAARALARQSTALEQANADLRQFARVMAHDLQEPTRIIHLYAQLLERRHQGALDEEGQEYVRTVATGSRRMYRLINDLLAYFDLVHHAREIEAVPLGPVVDGALSQLDRLRRETNARITVTEPLPVVGAQPEALGRVFHEILENALLYRHPDRSPVITLWAERRETHWAVCIQDNGPGIAPHHQTQIFEVFKRLHHETDQPGTGIGLALCQKLTQEWGGQVTVHSHPGEGSTFTLLLPDRPQKD